MFYASCNHIWFQVSKIPPGGYDFMPKALIFKIRYFILFIQKINSMQIIEMINLKNNIECESKSKR